MFLVKGHVFEGTLFIFFKATSKALNARGAVWQTRLGIKGRKPLKLSSGVCCSGLAHAFRHRLVHVHLTLTFSLSGARCWVGPCQLSHAVTHWAVPLTSSNGGLAPCANLIKSY